MVLFPPKFIINAMTLILIFLFWMAMFHVDPLMECIHICQLIRFARVCSRVNKMDRCRSKNGASVSEVLAFFNFS